MLCSFILWYLTFRKSIIVTSYYLSKKGECVTSNEVDIGDIDIAGIRKALAEDVDLGIVTLNEAGLIEESYLNNSPVTLEKLRETPTNPPKISEVE